MDATKRVEVPVCMVSTYRPQSKDTGTPSRPRCVPTQLQLHGVFGPREHSVWLPTTPARDPGRTLRHQTATLFLDVLIHVYNYIYESVHIFKHVYVYIYVILYIYIYTYVAIDLFIYLCIHLCMHHCFGPESNGLQGPQRQPHLQLRVQRSVLSVRARAEDRTAQLWPRGARTQRVHVGIWYSRKKRGYSI